MSYSDLKNKIESLYEAKEISREEGLEVFASLRNLLNAGEVRAAMPVGENWVTQEWVKKGILVGFRVGALEQMSPEHHSQWFDKDSLPLRNLSVSDKIRVVPGGTSVRDGAFLGEGVIMMPPAYVNIGAYVDSGSMVDSHALVGSCAQVGKNVHLSAGVQVGGVLEPINANPVIIEDDVLVGGCVGVFEGTIVRKGAVLGAGTILTRSTPVYDLVKETIYRASTENSLEIPPNAVVVPGSRKITKGMGEQWNLSLATPVIVKYRDDKTNQNLQLEDWLR